jgi:hypothetical protein
MIHDIKSLATIQNLIGVQQARGGCSDLDPRAIADRAAQRDIAGIMTTPSSVQGGNG